MFPVLCISIFWVLMFEEITPRISYWGSWKLCFVYILATWWLSDEIDFALVIYLWIHRMLPNGLVLKIQFCSWCCFVLLYFKSWYIYNFSNWPFQFISYLNYWWNIYCQVVFKNEWPRWFRWWHNYSWNIDLFSHMSSYFVMIAFHR